MNPFCKSLTVMAGGIAACLVQAPAFPAVAAEALRAGGTGAALGIVDAVGLAYATSPGGQPVRVLPSLGSGGGMRALGEKAIDMALIARRLNPPEAQAGMHEAACLRTPYALVTSRSQTPSLSTEDVLRLYREPAPAWPDGAKVKIILRPETETANQLLAVMIPGIDPVLALARQRSEIPKAVTDQDNAELAERTSGSLAAMGLAQLKSERRGLRPVALDGVMPSVATLGAGAYKPALDLCLIVDAATAPAMTGFIAFLRSAPGRAVLRDNEAFVADAP